MASRFNRRPAPPANVRLTAEGTRVVVLKGERPVAGIISDIRIQPHLRAYVVTCDDGHVVYASAYDLAREDDGTATPLGPRPVAD